MHDGGKNPDDLLGFGDQRVEPGVEKFASTANAQAKPGFLRLLERDSHLCDKVLTTGCAVGLLDVGSDRRSSCEHLIGKRTPDRSPSVKKLRCTNDVACEVYRSHSDLVASFRLMRGRGLHTRARCKPTAF